MRGEYVLARGGIRHTAQSAGDDLFEPERADGTRRGSLASPDFLLRTEVAFAQAPLAR